MSERTSDASQASRRLDQFLESWEKKASDYFDTVLRHPTFLNAIGGLLSTGCRNKAQFDRAMGALWKNLNLPNKNDQERTLHLLNELHSRIFDLEERISALTEENERLRVSVRTGS